MKDLQFVGNIQRHIDLDDDEKKALESLLVLEEIRNKDLLLAQGQVCKKLFFIESGSFRVYRVCKLNAV